jgi:FlgD Ig-like domain
VYAPPPLEAVVSPNGDGVAEEQKLSFKIVRPSTVTTTLTGPDGSIAWQEAVAKEPGTYDVAFPPVPLPQQPPPEGQPPPLPTEPQLPAEGRWTFTASATDDQGLSSVTTRRFAVNSTLASLTVAPARVVVRKTGGTASIRWTQARAARVKVTIETPEGIVVRTVSNLQLQGGAQSVTWDGRAGTRKPVAGGRYVAKVTAANELGAVSLMQPLTVRRAR